MSDRFDNGNAPQLPQDQGGDGQRPENMAPNGPIVPSAMTSAVKPLSRGMLIAWCVASGACAGISPIIAPLFVGFGYAAFAGDGGAKERAIACACLLVPAIACAFVLGFSGLEDAVFACIVGIVGSHLYVRNKLTEGVACMTVALLGVLFLAVSEGVARLAGTTLAGQFSSILDAYLASMGTLPIETRMVVDQMRVIVDAIWPTAFIMIAFVGFVLSIGGAMVAVRRQHFDTGVHEPYELFDLPLWMVGCLIAAVLILAASRAVPAYASQLMMLGGTMLGSLRLAFATQGYAVISWFKRSKGWFGLVGIAITLIAFYLEFNLFVLTVIGVLDIWLNLRHLTRGVRVTIQDPTDRS